MTQVDAVRRRILESVNAEWIDAAASAMSWPREIVVEALELMHGNVLETSNMMHDYCEYEDDVVTDVAQATTRADAENFLRYLRARLSDTRPA